MTLLRISDVLEDRHATSLLACIFLRGRMPKTALAQSVSNNPRMGSKIDRLEDLGFFTATKEGRRIVIDLTPRGLRVASMLCTMEQDVYGDVGDPGHVYEESCYPCSDQADQTTDWYATSRELTTMGTHR